MAFLVLDERIARAEKLIGACARVLGKQECLVVIEELGWSDLVEESETGGLRFEELTNLQIVGLAAALGAYREALHPE